MRSRTQPIEVWVLAVIAFFVALGFGVVFPLLPVLARTFGVSNLLAGLVVSSFAFVRLATMPAIPAILTRIDHRNLLIIGVLITAASSAMVGLSGSYPQLLVARAVGGFGSAMFTVSSTALLLAVAPVDRRGSASALYSGGFTIGSMAGPAVGGLLTAVSLQTPFLFYAATLVLSAVTALVFLPTGVVGRFAATTAPAVPLAQAIRDRRYRAAVGSSFANGWQSNGVRGLLVPLIVVETLLMSPSWTGVAFAIAAAAQTVALPVSGWASDRFGRRPLLAAGSLITAVVSSVFAVSGSYVALVGLLCVYGVGVSMSSTSSQAMIGDAVGAGSGGAIAAFQMAGDLGAIIGPLVAGALADRFSDTAGLLVGAVLLVVSAALAAAMPRRGTAAGPVV